VTILRFREPDPAFRLERLRPGLRRGFDQVLNDVKDLVNLRGVFGLPPFQLFQPLSNLRACKSVGCR
jgi:hypothetical protein